VRILVCDDDAAIMVMLGVALDDVEVVEASRQREAEALAAAGRLDGAVIDRRLPDGDGLALVKAIRREPRSADIPIVVLTAGYRPEDIEEVLASGADEYVGKPVEPLELADLIRRLAMLTDRERLVRRTLRRARAKAGHHTGGWDDLPEVPKAEDPSRKARRRARRNQ
jgi:two-component system response regulator RpaA